jgi:anaerobic selenocysteine-containing dehydrogenase
MTKKISRRDFLKIGGVTTAAAVLTGCGPTARYVTRKPYSDMPEYNQTGISTFYASTCRECPAGCGIIVRTMEGRAIKIEGNPDHPVNKGKLCSRGLTSVQGLYNPDRVRNPRKNAARGSDLYDLMKWEKAIQILQKALEGTPPDQIAILSGTSPDHMSIFMREWAAAMGIAAPIQYSPYEFFTNDNALITATSNLFGKPAYPFFDIANANLVVSFGADFLQSWLSPVAYSRYYRQFRTKPDGSRGKLIAFESRQSLTGGNADEWIPIKPGTFSFAAQAVGAIISGLNRDNNPFFSKVDINVCAEICNLDISIFQKVAREILDSGNSVVIPGSEGLNFEQVVAGTEAVLEINRMIASNGQPGGLYLSTALATPGSYNQIGDLVEKMQDGAYKLLLVHGVNPVFDLPDILNFKTAMKKVKQVISFSTFPDETAMQSDYVFPDHSPLESWGFHQALAGSDRSTYSSFQPVVSPFYDTKSSIDVLLASVKTSKKINSRALPYNDEVDFIQNKIQPLISLPGSIVANNIPVFWSTWLQKGGWWEKERNLQSPESVSSQPAVQTIEPGAMQNGKLLLQVYQTQLGDGYGANRPWLQETPNAQTTVMWNSWVELNPATAAKIGVKSDDIVKIKSQFGEIEAIVYEYPAIHPDCVAIPFGQGHTALGRYAANRGSNPAMLLPFNSPSVHSFQTVLVEVSLVASGKRKTLARYESKEGVYGHD